MKAGDSVSLSIVIPAYNEERRLGRTLERISAYLEAKKLPAEVVVVDDGSSDATAGVVESWIARQPGVRLLRNGSNCGKGFSVRRGILESQGSVVLLCDADLSAPIEEADKLLAAVEQGWDVVIGSRDVNPELLEVPQPPRRRLAGRVFRGLVRLLLGLPFLDTQCGFKAFRREAVLPVFRRQRIERFAFDPEILFLARGRGLKILEVGVRWRNDPVTRVSLLRDGLRMLADLLRVRWLALTGRYGQAAETQPGP